MAFIRYAVPSKSKFPFSPIISGVLQNGYAEFITPTRNYSGTTWTVVNHGGVSDSGYWGAYYYADWSGYGCNGNAWARITFTPECYGRTCTVTYRVNSTCSDGTCHGRLTANGSNVFNESKQSGTIDHSGETYTFTISSSTPYVEVYADYSCGENSRWSPSCNAGFYEVTIS